MKRVMVAIPALDSSVKTACMNSIIDLLSAFGNSGTQATVRTINSTGICKARNLFASLLLDSSYEHLLFVDNDMQFRPDSVQKLHDANVPVIGCAYPKRSEKGGWALWIGGALKIENGAADVAGVGMGLCLIHRSAFEKLKPCVRHSRTDGQGLTKIAYGFFDHLPNGDSILEDDYSFCQRWRNAGGSVRALLNEDVGHIGEKTYRGNFLEHMNSRSKI